MGTFCHVSLSKHFTSCYMMPDEAERIFCDHLCEGNLSTVERFYQEHPLLSEKKDAFFLFCIRIKKAHLAQFFLQKGANVDAKNTLGETALILSCQQRDFGSVEVLVKGGADLNCKNLYGHTPLTIASLYGSKEIESFLLSQGAKRERIAVDKSLLPHSEHFLPPIEEESGKRVFFLRFFFSLLFLFFAIGFLSLQPNKQWFKS